MGNMATKRVRKGIAKSNQAKKHAARVPAKTAAPAKTDTKVKK